MSVDYHICMMGPSRVGKTTLLASILEDFKKFSDNLYAGKDFHFEIKAIGDTYGRINDKISDLETYSKAGEFSPDAVKGTDVQEVYSLGISHKKLKQKMVNPDVKLHFHDFPGGWIKDGRVEETNFKESEIFIVPIDATLLMTASTTDQIAAAKKILEITSLKDVLAQWTALRAQEKNGLFILAPVKCESYFTDNQKLPLCSQRDGDLLKKVKSRQYYGQCIETVTTKEAEALRENKERYTHIQGFYMPVDTIGCCALSRQQWVKQENGGLNLKATFEIPRGCQWSPFGGRHIMMKILQYLAEQEQRKEGLFAKVGKLFGLRSDFTKEVKRLTGELHANKESYFRAAQLKTSEKIS